MNPFIERELEFATRVRALRIAREDSQILLGQQMTELGFPFHSSTVSKLESGARPVRLAEALALATLLEVDVNEMIASQGSLLGDHIVMAEEKLRAQRAVLKQCEGRVRMLKDLAKRASGGAPC